MRIRRLLPISTFTILAAASVASAASAASCANPRAEANMAQAMNDAANEISGLKSDLANLQTEMDSLRDVVAKQDSLITRIMAVNNIPR